MTTNILAEPAMRYAWKPGTTLTADPQAVGECLERIRERNGGNVTAADVVAAARRPTSPLHSCFEWDDAEAARKYRLDQARYILRSITVEVKRDGEPRAVRAFVVVTEGEDQAYTSVVRAMSDEELRRQVLQRAFRELEQFRERYREYEELAAVFAAIDAVVSAA